MENPDTTPQEQAIASEADLLTLAMQADNGEISADQPIEVKSESDSPTDEGKATADKAVKETVKDPAEGSETKKAEEAKAKEEADKKDQHDPNESKYSKAKREEERREKSWQKLQEEKETLRKEREEFLKEREAIKSEKAKAGEYRDKAGYTAQDYEDFAKRTDDPELAERARAKAQELSQEAEQIRTKVQQDEFIKSWQSNLDSLIKENPDLNNRESPIGQALQKVLNENPVFSASPDGIKTAYALAKAQQSASLVSGLNEQVKSLNAEIERLNKLTGLSGTGPNKRVVAKSFEEMDSKDQEAALERLALEADGGAY
jgi:DNA repair exonuclease SbcCD ATPase subunit